MAISYVGTANGATTTFTPPAHVAGDILICLAFRDGSNSTPTLPAGWTQIDTCTTNSAGAMFAYRVAVDNATASGTWTNATSTIVNVYRGVDTTVVIGGHAPASGASTTVSYPALTMTNATGTSWVMGASSHRSVDTNLQNAPTGMTARGTGVDAGDEQATHDTNGGVSSWSLQTVSVGGTSSGWCGFTVELLAAAPLTFVQGTTASATTTPATTTAFASNPTVGNLIVVSVSDDSGVTNNVSSVTDLYGNTYTQILTVASSSSLQMWYTEVASTGALFTVAAVWNPVSAGRCVIIAQEFSGFSGTPTLDKTTNTGSTGTAVSTGATAATTQAPELVVVGVSHDSTTSAYTAGLSYYNQGTVNVANAAAAQTSKSVLTTGAQTGTSTIAASRTWVAGVATFYDGTSGVSATVTQVAATVTAAGGTQVIATVNNVSITQVAANVTASGGTQTVAAVVIASASITQVAANVTSTGGTQVITTVNNVSITQVHATLTASGGTQTVVSVSSASIAQLAATVTATGGTQSVSAGSIVSASITQLAANATATGGTQTIASSNVVGITQVHATITATSGTQTLAAIVAAAIEQRAANVTSTGGTQSVLAVFIASITTTIIATLTSGGKSISVASGNTSQTIDSGGKIATVDSGNKNTTVTSGNKQTNL